MPYSNKICIGWNINLQESCTLFDCSKFDILNSDWSYTRNLLFHRHLLYLNRWPGDCRGLVIVTTAQICLLKPDSSESHNFFVCLNFINMQNGAGNAKVLFYLCSAQTYLPVFSTNSFFPKKEVRKCKG